MPILTWNNIFELVGKSGYKGHDEWDDDIPVGMSAGLAKLSLALPSSTVLKHVHAGLFYT